MRTLALSALPVLAGVGAAVGATGAPSAGERAFQKCYACHSREGPEANTEGPSLKGVVGREVAAQPSFRYSPALRALAARQPVWTREALDAFIADPQGFAPDNAMGFFGIRDPDERRALIDYLAAS
jgi:cytochrome c